MVYDPARVSYRDLLKVFWESHDPTQGMRQGNDVGTQYRSVIYTHSDDQRKAAAFPPSPGRLRKRRAALPRRGGQPSAFATPTGQATPVPPMPQYPHGFF